MRNEGNTQTYSLRDSIVTDIKYYSGYGNASGPIAKTDSGITFDETNMTKTGTIELVTDEPRPAEMSRDMPRNYLHVVPGTLGSDLGAGLFKK